MEGAEALAALVAAKLGGPVLELLLFAESRGLDVSSVLAEGTRLARTDRQRRLECQAARLVSRHVLSWYDARKQARLRKLADRARTRRTALAKWSATLQELDRLSTERNAVVAVSSLQAMVARAPTSQSQSALGAGNLSTTFDEAASLRRAAEMVDVEDEDIGGEGSESATGHDPSPVITPTSPGPPAVWTKHALDWMKAADPKWRAMLARRVGRILAGDRTYSTAKILRGTKRRRLLEAKLDSGMRVLWEDARPAVVIWFVVKHDSVSRIVRLIDDSDRRLVAAFDGAQDEGPLVDPLADTLLPCYRVCSEDLDRLATCATWVPPLALSDEERAVVEASGPPTAVLLLGRSGTGKTVCTAMRIVREAQRAKAARQVFVARSRRLCEHVARVLQSSGACSEHDAPAETLDLDAFVDRLAVLVRSDGEIAPWRSRPRGRRASFPVFRDVAGVIDQGARRHGVNALLAWTQIRCFIKGSAEAVVLGRRLRGDEFATNDAFNGRSRLDHAGRREALRVCDRYDAFLLNHDHYWDESDRMRDLASAALRLGWESGVPPFDRVYIDEAQDLTQAQVILALLSVGADPSRLWLCGDTAQCIAYGAHFRFADVRAAIHAVATCITNAPKYAAPKVVKLSKNYRTHSGVLNLAARVIDSLHSSFTNSAVDKLAPEVAFEDPRC